MAAFESFAGTITSIDDFWTNAQEPSGCIKLISAQDRYRGFVNFVVEPSTYFVDGAVLRVGDNVTGFYDPNVPTVMIYPPQYRALVMARNRANKTIKVDYFNAQLVSSDGTLRLNIARSTIISLTNGQPFTANLGNRNLIVIYGASTRSIPAQTTPQNVIVLCEGM